MRALCAAQAKQQRCTPHPSVSSSSRLTGQRHAGQLGNRGEMLLLDRLRRKDEDRPSLGESANCCAFAGCLGEAINCCKFRPRLARPRRRGTRAGLAARPAELLAPWCDSDLHALLHRLPGGGVAAAAVLL
mmetsp:Transcript_129414/g.238001  ORF Transcript_129414/g.238001 Transcript_129414/m.238001 type:complete len:131 (+) Transcript_129414:720-1112(+)